MASISIVNKRKNVKIVITDRDDQNNEIQFYERNLLSRVYKCRLESLSISVLYEKFQTAIENNIPFEIGYPNFLFHTEKSGDMLAVSFTAYPSDYYTIDLELGYVSDLSIYLT